MIPRMWECLFACGMRNRQLQIFNMQEQQGDVKAGVARSMIWTANACIVLMLLGIGVYYACIFFAPERVLEHSPWAGPAIDAALLGSDDPQTAFDEVLDKFPPEETGPHLHKYLLHEDAYVRSMIAHFLQENFYFDQNLSDKMPAALVDDHEIYFDSLQAIWPISGRALRDYVITMDASELQRRIADESLEIGQLPALTMSRWYIERRDYEPEVIEMYGTATPEILEFLTVILEHAPSGADPQEAVSRAMADSRHSLYTPLSFSSEQKERICNSAASLADDENFLKLGVLLDVDLMIDGIFPHKAPDLVCCIGDLSTSTNEDIVLSEASCIRAASLLFAYIQSTDQYENIAATIRATRMVQSEWGRDCGPELAQKLIHQATMDKRTMALSILVCSDPQAFYDTYSDQLSDNHVTNALINFIRDHAGTEKFKRCAFLFKDALSGYIAKHPEDERQSNVCAKILYQFYKNKSIDLDNEAGLFIDQYALIDDNDSRYNMYLTIFGKMHRRGLPVLGRIQQRIAAAQSERERRNMIFAAGIIGEMGKE